MKKEIRLFCTNGRQVHIKLEDGRSTCGSFQHVIDGKHFEKSYCERFFENLETMLEDFERTTSPGITRRC